MNPEYYDVYAHYESHHWWFQWRARLISEVVRSLAPAPGWKLLDAGCGTGGVLRQVDSLGECYGIDMSPLALAHARKHGQDRFVQADLAALPFSCGAFDCVLALDVIEHVDADAEAVRELARVVKPGGYLIVTVPAYAWLWSDHDVINHHRRRYQPGQLKTLLFEAGLEIDRFTGVNAILLPGVAAVRLGKNAKKRFSAIRSGSQPLEATEKVFSDLHHYPQPVNEALIRVVGLEKHIWRKRSIPFGVSILAVARKPVADMPGGWR